MSDKSSNVSRNDVRAFAARVSIVVLFGALAIAFWKLSGLLILLFGSVLVAIALRAAADYASRTFCLRNGISLAATVALLVALIVSVFWFFGSTIRVQIDELLVHVPEGLTRLIAAVQTHPYTRFALDRIKGAEIASATGWAAVGIAGFVSSLTSAVAYGIIMVFMAVYFAAEPALYRRFVLRLFPGSRTEQIAELFDRTGDVLRRWLLGQLAVMAIIGVCTGFGLWALGIKSALALGLLGGLLCFVPYVGAIVATIPATLVALAQSPLDAAIVLAMYGGVHFVEGNFLSPLIQKGVTKLPPVLSLVAIIAANLLFGPAGVLVAIPLTLFLLAAIDVLYVEPMLAADLHSGREKARELPKVTFPTSTSVRGSEHADAT